MVLANGTIRLSGAFLRNDPSLDDGRKPPGRRDDETCCFAWQRRLFCGQSKLAICFDGDGLLCATVAQSGALVVPRLRTLWGWARKNPLPPLYFEVIVYAARPR